MKLKSFMMTAHEYLDSLPSMSDAHYVDELRTKYSVTKDFAKQLLEEWKRERKSI